jgi:DNA-binding transcriptional LysR family regulator
MELRILRYFLSVAREGSITAAAENSLFVTQPTLSRQIMELETELGVKLFIRGKRKMTLTEEGIRLKKRAEEILELADKTKNEFSAGEVVSGDIYIGCGETEGMCFIAQAAKALRDSYPQVRFQLFSDNADEVTEKLDKGLLDFGILIGFEDEKRYESVALPWSDTWGLLVRKDNPLALKPSVTFDDLKGIPLIRSRQTLTPRESAKWIEVNLESLHFVATYNLIYNAARMVEAGVGSALCLDKLVDTGEHSNLCFRPFEPRQDSGLTMVWKRGQVFSKAAEKFLEQVRRGVGRR